MADPAESVLQMVRGAWVTMALRGACLLGVFDELGEPLGLEDLARRTSSDGATLARLLRVLVDLDLVEPAAPQESRVTAVTYRNTPGGASLRDDHPGRLRDLLLMQATLPNLAAWGDLEDAVRSGSSVFERVNGQSYWDFLAGEPEAQTRFNASMARRATGQVEALLAATDLGGAATLVDVGGGRGAMVAELLRALPGLSARVADQPAMAAEADMFFASQGLDGRASGAGCDFFASVPEGADVYTIANVLHDWDDADAVAILVTVRRAMPADARLLVVEHVLDAPGRTAGQQRDVHLVDLHMLVMFGARERTQAEYDELLVAAGFTTSELTDTGTDWNVLGARPAG
jgi:hypothetical protein